jgi:hypothetical protein
VPASAKTPPSPEPPSPSIDLSEYMRQRRERAQAARLEELWRENSAIPVVTRRDL